MLVPWSASAHTGAKQAQEEECIMMAASRHLNTYQVEKRGYAVELAKLLVQCFNARTVLLPWRIFECVPELPKVLSRMH